MKFFREKKSDIDENLGEKTGRTLEGIHKSNIKSFFFLIIRIGSLCKIITAVYLISYLTDKYSDLTWINYKYTLQTL